MREDVRLYVLAIRRQLDHMEWLLQDEEPHVDDRDAAYYRAQRIKELAQRLEDAVGNTQVEI